jgi:hypothetical protein
MIDFLFLLSDQLLEGILTFQYFSMRAWVSGETTQPSHILPIFLRMLCYIFVIDCWNALLDGFRQSLILFYGEIVEFLLRRYSSRVVTQNLFLWYGCYAFSWLRKGSAIFRLGFIWQ